MMSRGLIQQVTTAIVKSVFDVMVADFTKWGVGYKPVHRDLTGRTVPSSCRDGIPAEVPKDSTPLITLQFCRGNFVSDGKLAFGQYDDTAVEPCRSFEFYLEHFLLTPA